MRDLIRNYRNLLAGRTMVDSDSESQPLVSTSCSSTSSFGSFLRPSTPGSETDEGIEIGTTLTRINQKENSSSLSPLLYKKKYERQLTTNGNLEPSELEVYSAHTILYDKAKYEPIGSIFINQENMDVEKAQFPNVLKSTSKCDNNNHPEYREEEKKSTQSSLVTIFAIWNTTMGSSLLAMSWGLGKAGLIPGIIINLLVAGLCLYTCYLLLNVYEKHGISGKDTDISHLCLMLIGKWAEILAKIFSIVVLLGATIVYLILMSNFLYSSVYFLHDLVEGTNGEPNLNYSSVICPKENVLVANSSDSSVRILEHKDTIFDRAWDLYRTVPIYLAVVMFTVMNFKSPTFFAKFNSLGTISVMYLLVFVAVKAISWGINLPTWEDEFNLKSTFPALSGMLSLSYFIHNIIVPIMKNNRQQEHNGRDLSIAFGLVAFTYLFIGVIFYITFPLAKSCIQDNIFNNFSKSDTMTIVARILLMFQLFTVFPLIAFMLRNDVLCNLRSIFNNNSYGEFSYVRVACINASILAICIIFACALPKIGTLIRYTGALSGQVYIFMLPNLLKLASLKKEGELTTLRKVFHYGIIALGTLNLISQLFISD